MELIEYTDKGIFFLSAILIFVAIIISISELASNQEKGEKKKSSRIWALVITIFSISVILFNSYYNYLIIKENISYFEGDTYLKCSSGCNNYLVSKSRGWQRRDKYFINNNYILYAFYCEISKVQKEKEH